MLPVTHIALPLPPALAAALGALLVAADAAGLGLEPLLHAATAIVATAIRAPIRRNVVCK
jgi:hypothetical protein